MYSAGMWIGTLSNAVFMIPPAHLASCKPFPFVPGHLSLVMQKEDKVSLHGRPKKVVKRKRELIYNQARQRLIWLLFRGRGFGGSTRRQFEELHFSLTRNSFHYGRRSGGECPHKKYLPPTLVL